LLRPSGAIKLIASSVRGGLAGIGLIRGSRPDVILANTSTVPLWTVLARLCRIPVVTHVHEAEAYAPRLHRALLALPLLLSTDIITNSRFTADNLTRSLPQLRNRATVIYNGVPGPPRITNPRHQLDDELRVLYVGRVSYRKGVDVALDAVIQLREDGFPVRLDIVGSVVPGAEAYEAELRARIAAHNAGSYIAFHGYQTEVWPFLAAADLAVVPSRLDESFGNSAVEAVLAARPLVASGVSGLREAAGDYSSVQFVEPGNVQSLATAFEKVAHNWGQFRTAAAKDAIWATERHSPATYGEGIFRYVSEAAGLA
jgi:glycosyltransferase involved in cell wall biosynthesis